MAYHMSITLTDAEYAALAQEAEKNGKPVESLLREVLTQHLHSTDTISGTITTRKIQEYLYREGVIEHLSNYEPISPEEQSERAYLSHLFGQGQPASEMVIEDRGPR